ncbi:MAG: heavy-metal-associated domain-containing protein [Anaerolineae bacterium]|nr:heavy-metal-associated domain-containing protein [Anaerolineae bacterium]
MEKVTFTVPSMWADHHVLYVRQALSQVSGVQDVVASALYKDVVIQYDPTVVKPDVLANALTGAGYSTAEAPALPSYPERTDDSSDWFQFQERVTKTDERDLIMSGDHRKY